MVNPCYKCTERWVSENGINCHHCCDKYKKYSKESAEKATAIYSKKCKERVVVNYILDRIHS
jgi:hypothetical protein